DGAGVDEFLDSFADGLVAEIESHVDDAAGFAGDGGDFEAVGGAGGEGFVGEDMDAGTEGGDDHFGVEEIGGGDDDGVGFGGGDHLGGIGEEGDVLAAELLAGGGGADEVEIDEADDQGVVAFAEEFAETVDAATARADDADPEYLHE